MTSVEVLLEKFHRSLLEDSDYLVRQLTRPKTPNDNDHWGSDEPKRGTRKQFASYLVSVATHPIGLRASMTPYNCSQEQMLAYLMEVFKFNQAQLNKMLVGRDRASPSFIKKHSWRPEIKFKVGRPVFYQKEKEMVESLSVRVYLFKDRSPDVKNVQKASNQTTSENGLALFNFFRKMDLNRAILIRPVDQMVQEFRFAKVDSQKSTANDKNGDQKSNKCRLNVRRYYSDPKNAYNLRFEFWLKSQASDIGTARRLSRYLVHSNFFCPGKPNRKNAYSSADKVFYGFVNIQLTQVPAYAIKTIYPILSIREQRVNTTEISLEFRNRRILDDDKSLSHKGDKTSLHRSSTEFMVNHMRLYVNFLIFHILPIWRHLELNQINNLDSSMLGVAIDNLFYMPAYTLVNQHRLQSNLRQLEDQSLRRSAIMLLVSRLDELKTVPENEMALKLFQLLLVAVTTHEYVIAHRKFDGKTMQQLEVFDEESMLDLSREVVIEMELVAAANFFDMISEERLRDEWLSKLSRKSTYLTKTLALTSIRLAKTMIVHVRTNDLVNPKLKDGILKLGQRLEKTLAQAVTRYLQTILSSLLSSDAMSDNFQHEPLRRRGNFKLIQTNRLRWRASNKQQMTGISWQKLSRDVQQIDHDLSLHWSTKGIDCLEIDCSDLFKLSSKTSRSTLQQLIKSKTNKYLAEKKA